MAADGDLPETLADLGQVCIDCGDRVADRYLDAEGRCPGCRYGPDETPNGGETHR